MTETAKSSYFKTIRECLKKKDNKRLNKVVTTVFQHHPDLFAEVIGKVFLYQHTTNPQESTINITIPIEITANTDPLQSFGNYETAIKCFEHILVNNPNHLEAYQNLEETKLVAIDRFNYRMLNNATRNAQYKKAITEAIESGYDSVLCLDTIAGLFPIYVWEMHPKRIIATHKSQLMSSLASEAFDRCGYDTIVTLNKPALEITPEQLGGRVKLIIIEPIESGVLSKELLDTLKHAKTNLLESDGKMIPSSCQMYIAGFESPTLSSQSVVTNQNFYDSFYTKDIPITTHYDILPYDQGNVEQIKDFHWITNAQVFNEYSFQEMEQLDLQEPVRLRATETGFLDGFVTWFEFKLDDNTLLQTYRGTTWDQTIYRLNQRIPVHSGKQLPLPDHDNGTLKHRKKSNKFYWNHGKCINADEAVVAFLNNQEYLNALEYEAMRLIKRRGLNVKKLRPFQTVLDMSPFPYIGLILLKEKRIKRLTCSAEPKKLILKLANLNCIDPNCIEFRSRTEPIEDQLFDMVITFPLHPQGNIDTSLFNDYKLHPNGIRIPSKVELWGELVRSQWIPYVSEVENKDLVPYDINNLLNQFTTNHILNCHFFEHAKLSQPFCMGNIKLGPRFYEDYILVTLNKMNRAVNGILCYFKIYLGDQQKEPISTMADDAVIKNSVFRVGKFECRGTKVVVHFKQMNGIIKCSLS